jgi:hypothetical protein
MKVTAEEVITFLNTPVAKLALLDLLKERCDALKITETQYDSALTEIARGADEITCDVDSDCVECYAERRAAQKTLDAYHELFVRVFTNTFDNEYALASYTYCRAAYTEVQQTLERLNNLARLVEREELIQKGLCQIESTIREITSR